MRSARSVLERLHPISANDAIEGPLIFIHRDHAAPSVNQKRPSAAHAVVAVIVGVPHGAAAKSLDREEVPDVPVS
jgi:hypothetical protein